MNTTVLKTDKVQYVCHHVTCTEVIEKQHALSARRVRKLLLRILLCREYQLLENVSEWFDDCVMSNKVIKTN